MKEAITLDAGLAELTAGGLALPPGIALQLERYLALLGKWNRTFNLTAIREPERMVTHHVLDALAALKHLSAAPALRLLDIGSGGGLPGIPIAMARPGWTVVVNDSNSKKGAFLQQAIGELGIGNASAAIMRIETYMPEALFNVVISRAFSDLATLGGVGCRLLAPGGQLVAMKGVYPEEELRELPAGLRVAGAPVLRVPGLAAERHLIIMEAG